MSKILQNFHARSVRAAITANILLELELELVDNSLG